MDECMLNDLLECSVCLERLDTSSKVLPCQHTFCKKCLEEIVTTHKELRCPECRVLVDAKIEDLPPNVLLMRILEGMRNAPKKQQQRGNVRGTHVQPIVQHLVSQVSLHQNAPLAVERSQLSNKTSQQNSPHQPFARAVYDYLSKEPNDLSFKKGDIIFLRKRVDAHWYFGECAGKQGVFPSTYVQIMVPLPNHIPQCKALYDFRMTGEDEEGCLAFSKGAIINVIRRVDENWAEGRLNDRVGIFPLAFVELNNLARSLMKLSTNSQPGPSRVAPPTPTTEDSSPLIPTDHSHTVATTCVTSQQTVHTTTQGSESSSTLSSSSLSTTPNTSSSNTSSTSSTAPSSPTSPPPNRNNSNISSPPPRPTALHVSQSQSNQREKRHSFSALNTGHHHHSSHRHSAEILSAADPSEHPPTTTERQHKSESNENSTGPPVLSQNTTLSINTAHLPAAYVALYPYKPQKPDELELKKGGIYMVTERCQDGWYKGTLSRTQKCGVFPGNYVTPAKNIPRGGSGPGHSQTNITLKNNSSFTPSVEPRISVTYTRNGKSNLSGSSQSTSQCPRQILLGGQPPELPPRSVSPALPTSTVSCSWHGQPETSSSVPLGRSQSAVMTSIATPNNTTGSSANMSKSTEKNKERKEKGTVSLMRRLTSMKRSKSPPATSYSIDNPVFEDNTSVVSLAGSQTPSQSVHVRSGSCPSQLLQTLPSSSDSHHRLLSPAPGTTSGSQRLKHKERPHILQTQSSTANIAHVHASRHGESSLSGPNASPSINHHRKSNSLDAGIKSKPTMPSARERFRCIVPYPPNSEYELELRLNDIIYVHKKRDDGWYKGTQQRTGKTGLFPASFVESF